MADLLTKKQKKNVRLEYYIRLISVAVVVFSILCLFLLAYVIPYYISVSKKDLKVDEQFNSVIIAENKENVGTSVTAVVNKTADEIKVTELFGLTPNISSIYFSEIINNKNSNIKLTKLSFSTVKGGVKQLIVSGIADSRLGLVTFIDDLNEVETFEQVKSPVSDFAKDSDISFTLNINIKI